MVFYYVADRKKLPRLWLLGTFLSLLVISLDLTGFEIGLWNYPYKVLPIGPLIAYIDASPLPVIYMLEYQYFPKWQDFIIVSVVTAVVFAFCFEPITAAMGLYVPVRWEYHYGLPFYTIMPILMRMAVEKIFASAKEPS
ncbi:CBO0543 family protein [Sporomusa silvacetica]|uniref:CBO0543 family protein n=1 Tax=Sporomusa silvacetica TaxID=55504 RepID=UPI0035A02992